MAEVHRVSRRSTLASISLLLSVLVAALAAGSGFGTRLGWWNYRVGLNLLTWAVIGACLTGISSLVSSLITLPFLSETRGFSLSVLGLVISAIVIAIPVQWRLRAGTVPSIHDISTDLKNPPRFRVIQNFRDDQNNDLRRTNEDLASMQRKAYPKLDSFSVERSKTYCMKRALKIARNLNWTLRSINWETGHVEATDRTFWFGFKDDIVVRINSLRDGQCKIDVRSVSRHGKSDLGTNARRIKNYLGQIKTK